MKAHVHEHRDGRLALGLLVGTVIGAGVVWWFAPRLSGLCQRLDDSRMTAGIGMGDLADAGGVDRLGRTGQRLRDDLAEADADADAVARAADDGAPEPAASITR